MVPHQCLGAVWARRARKEGKGNTVAGTVLATIEQFNRVSLRVIATILKHTDLKTTQRAKIIQKWIDIAQVGVPALVCIFFGVGEGCRRT